MTQKDFETKLTSEQRSRLLEVYSRKDLGMTWEQFLESAQPPAGPVRPYVFVPWCGMWLGIETDGYCHS